MAHNWEKDFRYEAVQASMELVGEDIREDPFDYPFSFCLPISGEPFRGITPGKIMLAALVLGFAGLIAGVVIAGQSGEGDETSWPILILGLCCTLGGIGCFFLPFALQKRIVGWCIGQRGADLMNRAESRDIVASELGRADKVQIKIEGDDHVIILFDRQNQRILMEGMAARYLICNEDIVSISPFTFMSYLGADISYRIGEETVLRIAIAKSNGTQELVNQVPILFFLKRFIRNRILERFTETFELPS